MSAALPLLVVLTGPTGTGKSELALELAAWLDQHVPVEIVSADSALVYRGMDIGTAKPSIEARSRIAHHLIDIRSPADSFSAGEFVRAARASIDDIVKRGRLPLLVGGTMLYLRALHSGLAVLPEASIPIRQELDAQAAQQGWPALHARLADVDPDAARHIDRNDSQRIQRALEVYRLTGLPITYWQRQTHGAQEDFRWLRYALYPTSRADLQTRLAVRFDRMLSAGFVAEVRRLQARGDLTERHPSMRAVGYRQLWRYCRSECTLDEATQQAVTATAQLAKRQMTWLRREQGLISLKAALVGQVAVMGAQILQALAHDRSGAR